VPLQTRLVRIPLAAIRVTQLRTAWRTQRRCDARSISQLVRLVGARRWIHAVVVRPAEWGFYELIDGERRLESGREVGETHVDALVLDVDDAVALAISLLANLGGRGLRPIEKALLCSQVREALGALNGRRATQAEVGMWVGLKQPTVHQYLRIAEGFDAAVLSAAGATIDDLEPLSAELLESVARLPAEQRRAWLEDLKRGVRRPPETHAPDGEAVRKAKVRRKVEALTRECSNKAGVVETAPAVQVLAALAPLMVTLAWQVARGTASSTARAAAQGVVEVVDYRNPITSWVQRGVRAVGRGMRRFARVARTIARKLLWHAVSVLLASGIWVGVAAGPVDLERPSRDGSVQCQVSSCSRDRPTPRRIARLAGLPRGPPSNPPVDPESPALSP
jgi:ParB/RepB/Spo0J family partition protein